MTGGLPVVLGFIWAAITIGLILRAFRQFRAYRRIELATDPGKAPLPSLAVVVPARNEADVIGRCLGGLLAQDYPRDRLRVTIVDDGSTDGTATTVRRVAKGALGVALIEAGPLPEGWTGKAHACWRGAATAGADWLCFIDADVVPAPALLRCAVAAARRRRLDFLSLEPRQELESVWERLVIPAGLFALAFLGDLGAASDPSAPATVANGQFILIRRTAYQRIGGHFAVRDAICEDTRLAQAAKAAGYAVGMLGAARLIHTRMYRNLPALWEGLTKNSTETLGGTARALLAGTLAVPLSLAALIVPIALVAHAAAAPSALEIAASAAAMLASLAMFCLHVAGARYLGIPRWYGLAFPVGYALAAVIALDGLRRHWLGAAAWKGRTYSTRPDPRPGGASSD